LFGRQEGHDTACLFVLKVPLNTKQTNKQKTILLWTQDVAVRAVNYLWQSRHRTSDLVGTVINIHNGDWVRRGVYSLLMTGQC